MSKYGVHASNRTVCDIVAPCLYAVRTADKCVNCLTLEVGNGQRKKDKAVDNGLTAVGDWIWFKLLQYKIVRSMLHCRMRS